MESLGPLFTDKVGLMALPASGEVILSNAAAVVSRIQDAPAWTAGKPEKKRNQMNNKVLSL